MTATHFVPAARYHLRNMRMLAPVANHAYDVALYKRSALRPYGHALPAASARTSPLIKPITHQSPLRIVQCAVVTVVIAPDVTAAVREDALFARRKHAR
jgi:hypothetical protein